MYVLKEKHGYLYIKKIYDIEIGNHSCANELKKAQKFSMEKMIELKKTEEYPAFYEFKSIEKIEKEEKDNKIQIIKEQIKIYKRQLSAPEVIEEKINKLEEELEVLEEN